LEREGLVRIVPNHGAQVTPLSLEDFEEIYALRLGAEGLAARKAAEVARRKDEAYLQAALDELSLIAQEGSIQTYLKREWLLRISCYQISERPRLLATIRQLRSLAERYLRLAYQVEDDVIESLGFHRELVKAICKQDGDRADDVNRAALKWTVERAWPIVSTRVES
jgi:DNA-binding GntR family transcriptional regulator